jgi:hypothetical protein
LAVVLYLRRYAIASGYAGSGERGSYSADATKKLLKCSDNLREFTLTCIDVVKSPAHKDEKELNTLTAQLFDLFFQIPQLPDYIG